MTTSHSAPPHGPVTSPANPSESPSPERIAEPDVPALPESPVVPVQPFVYESIGEGSKLNRLLFQWHKAGNGDPSIKARNDMVDDIDAHALAQIERATEHYQDVNNELNVLLTAEIMKVRATEGLRGEVAKWRDEVEAHRRNALEDYRVICELRAQLAAPAPSSEIVAVPLQVCMNAVIALAHASQRTSMYGDAYEGLSNVVEQYRKGETAAPAPSSEAGLRAALQIVADWRFPETGKTWDDGTPTSYATEFGSHGERDYMKKIAADALATPSASTSPASVASGDYAEYVEFCTTKGYNATSEATFHRLSADLAIEHPTPAKAASVESEGLSDAQIVELARPYFGSGFRDNPETLHLYIASIRAVLAAAGRDAAPSTLSDAQIIGVLHSLGMDTTKSVNGFPELQVSATNLPGIRKVIEKCFSVLLGHEAAPAPMYDFNDAGEVVYRDRSAAPSAKAAACGTKCPCDPSGSDGVACPDPRTGKLGCEPAAAATSAKGGGDALAKRFREIADDWSSFTFSPVTQDELRASADAIDRATIPEADADAERARVSAEGEQKPVAWRIWHSDRWCFGYSGNRDFYGSEKWEALYTRPADDKLRAALEKIIEMNVQYCIDKYGDASRAETMGCVTVARAALGTDQEKKS